MMNIDSQSSGSKAMASHKNIREILVSKGIQPSAPRMAIASYVWQTDKHPTADEVKVEVEKIFPTVSLATVYNTLNLFVEKGLLREVQDASFRSIRYDCNMKPHFHFIDETTGEMMDLDPEDLQISPDFIRLGKEFEISGVDVTVRGRRVGPSKGTNKLKRKQGE